MGLILISLYLLLQLLLPLRHFLYPGNVSWTEEGHNFAWHMKLRDKRAFAEFTLVDAASGMSWTVYPDDFLTSRQVNKMATRPDMILQFSHFLANELRRQGYTQVAIHANAQASLNGRDYQPLIDPATNLAAQLRTWRSAPWIVPLDQSLR